jgi:hypothetical protein
MLHEEAISYIRDLLIEGAIAPGARIPEQAHGLSRRSKPFSTPRMCLADSFRAAQKG